MFKTFLDRLYLTSSINCRIELTVVLLFLGRIVPSNQDKISKSSQRTLVCCKIHIVLKKQKNLSNVFYFVKDCLCYDFASCLV